MRIEEVIVIPSPEIASFFYSLTATFIIQENWLNPPPPQPEVFTPFSGLAPWNTVLSRTHVRTHIVRRTIARYSTYGTVRHDWYEFKITFSEGGVVRFGVCDGICIANDIIST